MIEVEFKLKCSRCNFDKFIPESKIAWNEDETCDCPSCGKSLRFVRSNGTPGYSFRGDEK